MITLTCLAGVLAWMWATMLVFELTCEWQVQNGVVVMCGWIFGSVLLLLKAGGVNLP